LIWPTPDGEAITGNAHRRTNSHTTKRAVSSLDRDKSESEENMLDHNIKGLAKGF